MVALPPLASVLDLEERLGRTMSGTDVARVEALLRDASAAVRRFTGQEITFRRSTGRARIERGSVVLPQQPVTAVHGVVTIPGTLNGAAQTGGTAVAFSWYAGTLVDAASPTLVVTYYSSGFVDVDYSHGFEQVPDDLVAVVCQMAGRALGRPADSTGVTSETIGSYSVTVGAAAAAGAVGLLDDERAILRGYRPPQRPIQTVSARGWGW